MTHLERGSESARASTAEAQQINSIRDGGLLPSYPTNRRPPPLQLFAIDPDDNHNDERVVSAIVIYNLSAVYRELVYDLTESTPEDSNGVGQDSGRTRRPDDLAGAAQTTTRLVELSMMLMSQGDAVGLTAAQREARDALAATMQRGGNQIISEMGALLQSFHNVQPAE